MKKVDTLFFDFDGVIRIYNEIETTIIESEYSIPLGSINQYAFELKLLNSVTTGKISRDEWIREIGLKLNNIEAAEKWNKRPIKVNNELLEGIKKMKCSGLEINIITNGTNNFRKEIEAIGVVDHFQKIHNSAEIGIAKPSKEIFQHILNTTYKRATNCAFIDDSIENIIAAKSLGFQTFHFSYPNNEQLYKWIKENVSEPEL